MRIIESKRAVRSKFEDYEKILQTIPALMGDANGVVSVPGQTNYVYAREMSGNTIVVWNTNVPLIANLAIKIGVLEGRLQVVSIRDSYYNFLMAKTPPHGSTHSYLSGATDITNIYAEQFMPWYASTKSGSPFTVTIRKKVSYSDGSWVVNGTEDLDLSSYIPVSGTDALYLLITLSEVGVLTVTEGSPVTNKAALTLSDIPSVPAGHIPLWAVILYVGQSAITRNFSNPDYLDLRFARSNTHSSLHAVGGIDSLFPADPGSDQYLKWNNTTNEFEFDSPTGSGDVVGPAGAVNGNLAVFDGVTGKLLKDGGSPSSGSAPQTDQSGGTGDTYGVLAGAINGSNALFTVSLGSYTSGKLLVYRNGLLQTQGSAEDWVETTPASGTFTFNSAPKTGDLITVVYN